MSGLKSLPRRPLSPPQPTSSPVVDLPPGVVRPKLRPRRRPPVPPGHRVVRVSKALPVKPTFDTPRHHDFAQQHGAAAATNTNANAGSATGGDDHGPLTLPPELNRGDLALSQGTSVSKSITHTTYRGSEDVAAKSFLLLSGAPLQRCLGSINSVRHSSLVPVLGTLREGGAGSRGPLRAGEVIVVTPWVEGSLRSVIIGRDAKTQVPMLQRVRMMIGVAKALMWLHESTPSMCHGSLSMNKVLIDGQLRSSVRDYGLAPVLSADSFKRQYFSPERKETDGPASPPDDVFALGTLVWEVVTGTEWCGEGDRSILPPIIKDSVPTRLTELIALCCDEDPAKRPTAEACIDALEDSFVDVAIADEGGRSFWKTHFGSKEKVLFDDLSDYLYQVSDPTPVQYECVRTLLAQEHASQLDSRSVVTLRRFGDIMSWFGPMGVFGIGLGADKVEGTFLERVEALATRPWFFGDLNTAEAEALLNGQGTDGVFLVRFSTSAPGCFTASVLSRKARKIIHVRLKHCIGEGVYINKQCYADLTTLIRSERKTFKEPCPGSHYANIMRQYRRGGRLLQESDYVDVSKIELKLRLYVWIIEGYNLLGCTRSDTSDPYVMICLGQGTPKTKTKTVTNSLSPSWDEMTVIDVDDEAIGSAGKSLQLDVLHYQKIFSDVALGTSEVILASLKPDVVDERWLTLKERRTDLPTSGSIRVRCLLSSQMPSLSVANMTIREAVCGDGTGA